MKYEFYVGFANIASDDHCACLYQALHCQCERMTLLYEHYRHDKDVLCRQHCTHQEQHGAAPC